MIGKAFLPKSLFGRALLILILPTVLIQLVMAFIFFDRHWDNVTRYMASSLAGEIGFLIDELDSQPEHSENIIRNFEGTTNIDVFIDPPKRYKNEPVMPEFAEFQEQLRPILHAPFTIRKIENGTQLEIRIFLSDRMLRLETTVKRLESKTTVIYVLWMAGSSVLFLLIAVLFLRNQIRPIRKLAEAADNFGRGVDMPEFRPSGAAEVRKAARAFIVMRERIKRQLRTRTEMLAGISHDLRTPLTRMKLQLAMLTKSEAITEMHDDVQQMEHMIQEYLAFARGEGGEEAIKTSLRELLEDVVSDYHRLGSPVTLEEGPDVMLDLRVISFRRMLHNVIDNALRYGKSCTLALHKIINYCEITIDDKGPGIPEEKRDEVFKPFNRLEPSRNTKTGGVGLGLTIARDIILAHGGNIALDTAPTGGLRVVIRLPL